MIARNYEFEVLVNGKPVQEYLHEGNTFIEGKEGAEFSLRMSNNSNSRALFVPTIDGLSIMDGKEASFRSRGYIVGAYSSTTIDGWRLSNSDVAKFFFSAIKDSYAKRSGKGTGNVGIIGCAVFQDRNRAQYPKLYFSNLYGTYDNKMYVMRTATLSNTPTVMMASSNLGTGFGDKKYSPVTEIEFDREDSPSVIFTVYYNTRENLEKLGVVLRRPVFVTASAFPKEAGYCDLPPGWGGIDSGR